MKLPALLSIVLLALASACGETQPPPPEAPDGSVVTAGDGGPAQSLVEVGTGTESFVPLADGETVPVIAGPQGGFHIWTSVRVRDPIDPQQLLVRVRVLREATELSGSEYRLNFVKNGAYYEWYALTAFVPDPAAVAGKDVHLSVSVTDSTGRTASDTRRVVPQGP